MQTTLFFLGFNFLFTALNWMILSFLPLYLKALDFGDVQIGAAIGVYSFTNLLFLLPFGFFADLVSPKRLIILGCALFTFYVAGLGYFHSFPAILFSLAVGGLGYSILQVIVYPLFIKVIGKERRLGLKVGFYHTGVHLGYAAGPLAFGLLLNSWGYAKLFHLILGLAILVFLVSFFLPDTGVLEFKWQGYRQDWRKRESLILAAIVILLGLHFGVEQTSFSLLLQKNLGLSGAKIGFIFAAVGVWMALISPGLGRMVAREHWTFRFLLGGFFISAFFQVCTGFAASFLSMAAIRVLHTLGDAMTMLAVSILTARYYPEGRLGGNFGVLESVKVISIFVAAVAIGAVNKYWGYQVSFLLSGALIFCSGLFLVFFHKRLGTIAS